MALTDKELKNAKATDRMQKLQKLADGSSLSKKETAYIVLILVVIIIVIATAKQNKVETRNLTAGVLNQGDFFVVRNNDTFAWGDCDLNLNDDYSISGISIPPASADNTIIQASDFATKKGERFNPMEMKAQTLFIYCRQTPYGTLSYMGGWK